MKSREIIIGIIGVILGLVIGALLGTQYLNNYLPATTVDTAKSEICKYSPQGKITCPGFPNQNVQLCTQAATETYTNENGEQDSLCDGDEACILSQTQSCLEDLDSVSYSSANTTNPDGSCRIDDALERTVLQKLDNCPGTIFGTSCVFRFSTNGISMSKGWSRTEVADKAYGFVHTSIGERNSQNAVLDGQRRLSFHWDTLRDNAYLIQSNDVTNSNTFVLNSNRVDLCN